MALQSDYASGTISVDADGTAVTGVGTAWQAAGFREGTLLFANGYIGVVKSVESNTALTLDQPWRGGALSGAAYRLRYQSDGSSFSAQARALIEMLGGSGNLEALGGLQGAPNLLAYFTGAGQMGLTEFPAAARALLAGDTDDEMLTALGFTAFVAGLRAAADAPEYLEALGFSAFMAGLTTATNGAAVRNAIGVPASRNLVINPLFDANQRGVTGTVTLAAGVYGHDRFKAGAAGCTYTFSTNNGVTTINITAGSLQQVVESICFSGRAGTYVLSWQGSAQGRIGTGAYGASGAVSATCDGSAHVTLEWTAGTLSLPQFERAVVTDFSMPPIADDLASCQRYFLREVGNSSQGVLWMGQSLTTTAFLYPVSFPTTMRVDPSIALVTAPTYTNVVPGSLNYIRSRNNMVVRGSINAAGLYRALAAVIDIDAEL